MSQVIVTQPSEKTLSNAIQFIIWIVIQTGCTWLIAVYLSPLMLFPFWIKVFAVAFAFLWQILAMLIALGLLNTAKLTDSQLVVTSTLVETVVVYVVLGITNYYFGDGRLFTNHWQVITALLIALVGSPAVLFVSTWVANKSLALIGYLSYGAWLLSHMAVSYWLLAHPLADSIINHTDWPGYVLGAPFYHCLLMASGYGLAVFVIGQDPDNHRGIVITTFVWQLTIWMLSIILLTGSLIYTPWALVISLMIIPFYFHW